MLCCGNIVPMGTVLCYFCFMINIIKLIFKLIVELVSFQSEIIIIGLQEFVCNNLFNTSYNFTIIFDHVPGMSTYIENNSKSQKWQISSNRGYQDIAIPRNN